MTAELCACACVMGCEQEAYRDTLLQTLVEAPNSTIPPDRLWPVMYVDFTLPNLLLVRSLRLARLRVDQCCRREIEPDADW
jgi:hypothetical protein